MKKRPIFTDFQRVGHDLYILKSDVERMERGFNAIGYISIPDSEKHKYELISQHAFQLINPEQKLDGNSFNVVFILK